ncbi:hypothetical protein BD289DRAFT_448529 [Coniella lustricola]|uniref:Uncharacterized protein n=1 Tax=Coniella lustricola TaxID=2025994 RepID=A0A2T2ZS28_9PEZI|nr:hypothetical protein BD289DRAFT_448529 [Coniella lustricola]
MPIFASSSFVSFSVSFLSLSVFLGSLFGLSPVLTHTHTQILLLLLPASAVPGGEPRQEARISAPTIWLGGPHTYLGGWRLLLAYLYLACMYVCIYVCNWLVGRSASGERLRSRSSEGWKGVAIFMPLCLSLL